MEKRTSPTEYGERYPFEDLEAGDLESRPCSGVVEVVPGEDEGFWPGYRAASTFLLAAVATFFLVAMQDDPSQRNSYSMGLAIAFTILIGLLVNLPPRPLRRVIGGLAFGLMIGMIVGRFF